MFFKKMVVGFIGTMLNNGCRFQEPDSFPCVVHQCSTCLDHWYLNWVPHCKNTKVEVVLMKYALGASRHTSNLLPFQSTSRTSEEEHQGKPPAWLHCNVESHLLGLWLLASAASLSLSCSSHPFQALFWCCQDRPHHLGNCFPAWSFQQQRQLQVTQAMSQVAPHATQTLVWV